jgi:hypothetical protein
VRRLPEHRVKSPDHQNPYPHAARLILILSLAPTIGLGIAVSPMRWCCRICATP